jgi:hypothetical protein
MARAATAPELALYRSEKKWSKFRAAILPALVVYTARINQTFSTYDGILEIIYDTGSGTLADVLPDMTILIGSTAGAHDIGIVRLRDKDATHFYIGETSDVRFANDQYLTVIADFGLWARHVLISSGVPYMDGGISYSNQHALPDPTPVMGSNRVLKLTGASVSTSFDGSASYVVDGTTIASYAWSAPGSSSSSGMTTATPTIAWNSVGWKLVYLTITGTNGKTYFGVRYVYVWNDANPPARAQFGGARQDVESGGWEFDLTLFDDADLDSVRDHALVILFSEDYFNGTQSNIGPVAGSENIEMVGWIAKEQINWNPEQGSVRFTAYTAHYWFSQIPSFPDGVEFVTGTPTAWTEMQLLTVRKGLWHFLHWRSTATRIMDVFLTFDTKYTTDVSSLASNLWEQIREMAFLQIFARAGVNAWNQLFIQTHPQLVPQASRSGFVTVMTITKEDWRQEINFDRVTKPECAVVSLSGVAVNSSGVGSSYFSLSPGHAYPHYGAIDVQDRLLVSGQADANQKAGLYRGWRNNPYPEIPISLAADIRLIDCFPIQQCAITINAGDTPRGNTYSGNLFPTAIAVVPDDGGYYQREVTFEAETFEDINVNGDIPGSRADVSIPPPPSLPPLPDLGIIIPGTLEPSSTGPKTVLFHDPVGGFILAENFDTTPVYRQINAGLTTAQYQQANFMFVTPSGAMCVGKATGTASAGNFIARAPSVGGTFTIIYNATNGLFGCGYNPLVSDYICAVAGITSVSDKKLLAGAGGSLTVGAAVTVGIGATIVAITYGLGKWLATAYDAYQTFASNGLSVSGSGSISTGPAAWHIRASTTGKTFHERNGITGMVIGENNLATHTLITDSNMHTFRSSACDPTGTYLMMEYGVGNKGKSSDGGYSWSLIPSLPVGNWYFAYAGPGETSQRFIAAGAVVRYTPDFGTTWINKENSSLTDIYAFPAIDLVQVLEF